MWKDTLPKLTTVLSMTARYDDRSRDVSQGKKADGRTCWVSSDYPQSDFGNTDPRDPEKRLY